MVQKVAFLGVPATALATQVLYGIFCVDRTASRSLNDLFRLWTASQSLWPSPPPLRLGSVLAIHWAPALVGLALTATPVLCPGRT